MRPKTFHAEAALEHRVGWARSTFHRSFPCNAFTCQFSLSLFSLSFSRRDIEIFKSTFYNNGNTSKNYSKGIKLQEIYVREFSNNSLDVGQCTLARVRLYQSRTRILSVFLYSSFFLRTFARATVMVTLLAAEVGFEESFGTLRVTLARS